MPGAIGEPRQEGAVIYIDMGSVDNTATRGDYVALSAKAARAVATGNTVALFPLSGIGIALGQNPIFDSVGSASANGKLPVATHRGGILRVSAVTGNYSAGLLCFPISTGSGIVAQTGRTGAAAVWSATAALPGLVAAAFAVNASSGSASSYAMDRTSAVGRIVRVVLSGATGQWDIILLDPFAANAPQLTR